MKYLLILSVILSGFSFINAAEWIDRTTGISWEYSELGDGTVSIGIPATGTNYSGKLIVPGKIDFSDGKSKSVSLFTGRRDCKKITSVVISKGITCIGYGAFERWTALNNVELPDGVLSIDSDAFNGCEKLETVRLPEGIQSIGTAFYFCFGLKNIRIPGSVKNIEMNAFRSCRNLECVILSEGVEKISSVSFYECEKLRTLTIPSTVHTLEAAAFLRCYNLKELIFRGPPPVGVAEPRANLGISLVNIFYSMAYADQWGNAVGSNRLGFTDVFSCAKATILETRVKKHPTKPESLQIFIRYKVTDSNTSRNGVTHGNLKVRAIAFKDGVRILKNVIPIKTGISIPDGNVVYPNQEYSFTWDVSEDLKDVSLCKMMVEILVQDRNLLPEENVWSECLGDFRNVMFSRNAIPRQFLFNSLLWQYAAGDPELTLEGNAIKYKNKTIAYGDSIDDGDGELIDENSLLDYFYSKLGFRRLTGKEAEEVEHHSYLHLQGSGIRQRYIR